MAGTLAQKIGWRIGQKTGLENSPGNWHRKLIGKWSENHPENMLENGPRIYQKTTKWQTQIRKMARHAQPWRAITIQSRLWPAMASHGQLWPAMASHGCPRLPSPWDPKTQHRPRANDPTPSKTLGPQTLVLGGLNYKNATR